MNTRRLAKRTETGTPGTLGTTSLLSFFSLPRVSFLRAKRCHEGALEGTVAEGPHNLYVAFRSEIT